MNDSWKLFVDPNISVTLFVQDDCNVVLYDKYENGWESPWSSESAGKGKFPSE